MLTTFLFLCLIEYFLISEVFFQLSRLLNSWLCRQLCLEGKVLVAEKSFTEDTAVTLHQLQWKCKEFLASCQRMVLWLHTKSYMLRKDRKLHFYLRFFLWDQTLLKVLRWYSRFQAWQFTIREHRPCSLCSVLCLVPCTVSTVAILHFLTECSSTFSCSKQNLLLPAKSDWLCSSCMSFFHFFSRLFSASVRSMSHSQRLKKAGCEDLLGKSGTAPAFLHTAFRAVCSDTLTGNVIQLQITQPNSKKEAA